MTAIFHDVFCAFMDCSDHVRFPPLCLHTISLFSISHWEIQPPNMGSDIPNRTTFSTNDFNVYAYEVRSTLTEKGVVSFDTSKRILVKQRTNLLAWCVYLLVTRGDLNSLTGDHTICLSSINICITFYVKKGYGIFHARDNRIELKRGG